MIPYKYINCQCYVTYADLYCIYPPQDDLDLYLNYNCITFKLRLHNVLKEIRRRKGLAKVEEKTKEERLC